MRKLMGLVLRVSVVSVVFSGCGGSPPRASDSAAPPAWTEQPARSVDAGYIVYVGSGEDASFEKARFKAESMAMQDLANECTFAPKGARIEDHFAAELGVLHRSFAKVAVEFADCEAAKAANSPDKIRTLANASMTEQLKRYRDLVDAPEPEEATELAQVPALPGQAPPSAPIQSPQQWVIVRQQIVFAKETVILAPSYAYAPQSPEAIRFTRIVEPHVAQVRAFETSHPELAKAPAASFSSLRPNSFAHRADSLRKDRVAKGRLPRPVTATPPTASKNQAYRPKQGGKGKRGKGKRRRVRELDG